MPARKKPSRPSSRPTTLSARIAELERELDRRARAERSARALAEVSRHLAGTLDLAEAARRLAEVVLELFGVSCSALFRLDPASGSLACLASAGDRSPEDWVGQVLPPGSGVTGRAVAEGRVVATARLLSDPRVGLPEWALERHREAGYHAAAAAPLTARGRVLGALAIADRAGRVFLQDDLGLLAAVADQAALALDNARLYAGAESRRRASDTLARLARELTSSLDVDTVGARIVEAVLPLFAAASSGLRLLQPDGSLVAVAWGGRTREHVQPGHALAPGEGVAGRAVREGRAVRAREPLVDRSLALTPGLRERMRTAGHRATLTVPLRHGAQVLGTLSVSDTEPREFSEEEVALLQAFGDQAALAIVNARLHEETERRRREAEAVVDLTRAMNASLDLDTVLQRVVLSARDLCGADLARIALRDPGTGRMPLRHWVGPVAAGWRDVAIEPGRGLGGLVMVTGRSQRTDDYAADPCIGPDYLPLASEEGIVAAVAVPIRRGQQVDGVLFVLNCAPRPFSERHVAALERLADHAAVALGNAQNYAAARESEARYRALVEASIQGVCVHRDFVIRFANPALARMLGYAAAEDLHGRPLWEILAPEERSRVEGYARARTRDEASPSRYEVRGRRRDGTPVWLEVLAAPVTWEGSPAILGAFVDVTERKATEAEVLRHRELRFQSEKLAALGQLLAGIAHEINNPLSVVVGQAALLAETPDAGPAADRAGKILRAATRCARIVDNFLALARHRPTAERRRLDLNQVARDALELVSYQLRVDDVAVETDLAEDLPAVEGDAHQLHQVVVNLVSNAHQSLRTSPAPRRLSLRTCAAGRHVTLDVMDTGPGIPLEVQPLIFDPFFTTKPAGQGTGLGLSLSRGIVEAHEGTIGVESAPGAGATFRVTLPAVGASTEAAEAASPPRSPVLPGARILVVDDEPEIADLMADALREEGHAVEVAANGREALACLAGGPFDVILSDVRMPELDGPGLYRAVERSFPWLLGRMIFVTGDALTEETRRFLEGTRLPTIGKPFTLEQVRDALHRLLAST